MTDAELDSLAEAARNGQRQSTRAAPPYIRAKPKNFTLDRIASQVLVYTSFGIAAFSYFAIFDSRRQHDGYWVAATAFVVGIVWSIYAMNQSNAEAIAEALRNDRLPSHKRKVDGRNFIACPCCGRRGPGVRRRKGSAVVMVFLLCIAIIPGLLYAILCNGYTLSCPKCNYRTNVA